MSSTHYSADENDGTLNRSPKLFKFRAPILQPGRGKKSQEQLRAEREFTEKTRPVGLYMTPNQLEQSQGQASTAPTGGVVKKLRETLRNFTREPRRGSWLGDSNSQIFQDEEPSKEKLENWPELGRARDWEQKTGEREWAEMDARTHNPRTSDLDTYGTECEGCHNSEVVGTCHNCREKIRANEESNPIRIPPIFEPDQHHETFAQCDHDPTTPCEDTPHGPLGHIVTVWNGDGAIGGLGMHTKNIGMITGLLRRDPRRTKILSDAAVDKHSELCDHRLAPEDIRKTMSNPEEAHKHSELCDSRLPFDKKSISVASPNGGSQVITHAEGCKGGINAPTASIEHDKNCPFRWHRDHCAKHNPDLPFHEGAPQQAWLHSSECPLNDLTETSEFVPGQTQFHITLLDQMNPRTKGKLDFGRAKINHNGFTQTVTSDPIDPSDPDSEKERTYKPIETTLPQWQQAGIGGMRKGIVVEPNRVSHVPTDAVRNHLEVNERTGRLDMRQYFGDQGGVVGGRPTTGSFMAYLPNPFGASKVAYEKLKTIQPIKAITDQLEARKKNPKLWDTPMESNLEKTFEPNEPVVKPKMDIGKLLPKKSYVHVTDSFQQGVPCRFCDDPSNTGDKGEIIQTGMAANGRPLYAHEKCDDPFAFAQNFKTLLDDGTVEVDFIPSIISSYDYGITSDTRKVDSELGIDTPSSPPRIDSAIPPSTTKIPKLPKVEKMTRLKSTNLGDNGQAIPPAK